MSVVVGVIAMSLMLISKNAYCEDTAVARDGSYIKYASGVVLDKTSGLEWFVGPDKDITFDHAREWIASLRIGGGGWRLPKTSELQSLYKRGAGTRNMSPLLKTTGWIIWSVVREGNSFAWPPDVTAFCVDFNDGGYASCFRNFGKDKRVFAVRVKTELPRG